MDEALDLCPPVRAWFERRFAAPTPAQAAGWPAIAAGGDVLIAAPTGSGKTLTAFLLIIDRLVRRSLEGRLTDQCEAIYVSPLRALSHDIQRNLETPLEEIRAEARAQGLELPPIRAAVRTGDTSPSERQGMLRRAPHILVTTPESLYVMLTSDRARKLLATARTVIVDEIHALARDKRGSHLALSLARLDALCGARPVRIGLSATQRPMDEIARFLCGGAERPCRVIDLGHQRDLDLAIDVPPSEDLAAVATKEQWDDLIEVLAGYTAAHRTTLIFTNTRRLAERLAHRLGERIGAEHVAAHHGSLSRERRLKVEARLKAGELRALVATASLELGIDIGEIELVCQIGSPRSIATALQRIGRSGHALGLRPKGRLFPTSRDELCECAALVRAVRAGRLDKIVMPEAPLDILAQQIVATCATGEWTEEALFELARSTWPFRALERADFDAVVTMLADGFETPKGRRATYLHRDQVNGRVRARRGARLAALMSGGAIPEVGDYRVVLDPDDTTIGTVNEDWAIESNAGDVFLLGTHSWRIRRVESAVVRVTDAQGAPPSIPFWLGEAPARTVELSHELSELRTEVAARLEEGLPAAVAWLERECGLAAHGAEQIAKYIDAQKTAVGFVPTCDELLAERFFDEAGGMQLVIHSPNGGRVNRGLGLALRKRFCASFNQELQAAATDDAVVLSLGNPQTFDLETLPRFLQSGTVAEVLEQALLGSPMFTARWRWNATRSLAVLRSRGKGRVPFPIQRMQADDLLAAAFPDVSACQENVTYPIEIPDHPLVAQTMRDCLCEASDVRGLERLLASVEAGSARFRCLDTVEPSPFAHEILNARPYAFLDDAPLEERRTRAVSLRHALPADARDLAKLDPAAIAQVREEAAPIVRDPDELHELLCDLVVARPGELAGAEHLDALFAAGRAARVPTPDAPRVLASESAAEVRALFPGLALEPEPVLPPALAMRTAEPEAALDAAVRGHLALLGPVEAASLSTRIGVGALAVESSLARLEGRGIAVRGRFEDGAGEQFCERSLLARIHRYTLARLRREIEPVSARVFLRFLLEWQHVAPGHKLAGEGGLLRAIEGLSGFEAAAASWEAELLPARVDGYKPALLDALCLSGAVAWGRVVPAGAERGSQPSRLTPIGVFPRAELDELLHQAPLRGLPAGLRGPAERVLELLRARGALFAREIEAAVRLLPVELEEGLRELVAQGVVSCDGFAPLRRLLGPARRDSRRRPERRRVVAAPNLPVPEGRWHLLAPASAEVPDLEARAESLAWRLLRRYGVVFRDLVAREWLPDSWRAVHAALRRLEARGLVRGGRFVTGFTGEQFALPDAIPLLRRARSRPDAGEIVRVSAADPLNLVGVISPGARVPAGHTRWIVFRDGLPIAAEDRSGRSELERAAG
ncbi:MAG TPA: DEAD/DEAH box helicase [Myxococcota bacterium]|nr:DEAD/DEAH box helicase [Myxococcota bacterium]